MNNFTASIRNSLRDGIRLIVVTSIVMFVSSCDSGGSGGSKKPPTIGPVINPPIPGQFRFEILDSIDPKITFSEEVRTEFHTFFDPAVEFVNSVVSLPENDMPIYFTGCGVQNAYFDSSIPEIVMCSELLDLFFQQFQIILEDVDDPEQRIPFAYVSTFSAYNFVLYHEIAHALHVTLKLGIAGNRESAADAIATVLSVEHDRAEYPMFAALLLLGEEDGSFGDVHSGGLDRAGDVICWTLGGDPELASDNVFSELANVFTSVGRDCVGEYAAQQSAVYGWLPELAKLRNTITAPIASRRVQQPSNSLKNLDAPAKRELADLLTQLLLDKR